MKLLLFIVVTFFMFVKSDKEFPCENLTQNVPGNPGCICKCVQNEKGIVLNRIIVDQQNCDDIIIKNKVFNTVKKDVIIEVSPVTSRSWRLEIISSGVDSISNLADASIGSEKIRYESIYLHENERLPLTDLQPFFDQHASRLLQQISKLKVNRGVSKVSLEADTFIFPGAATDLSTITYQPEFTIQSTPFKMDVQSKFWFTKTNKGLWFKFAPFVDGTELLYPMIFSPPTSEANEAVVLDVIFDQIGGEIKITKSILQYVNALNVLCLPKDTSRALVNDTYQLTVEYGSLGINKMIADTFGLNCATDNIDCFDNQQTITEEIHSLWSKGDCQGIKNQQEGKNLCIYCVPHFFNPSNTASGKHTFFNLNRACYGSDTDFKPFVDEKLRKSKEVKDLKKVDQVYLDKWSKVVGYMPEIRDELKDSDNPSKPSNPDNPSPVSPNGSDLPSDASYIILTNPYLPYQKYPNEMKDNSMHYNDIYFFNKSTKCYFSLQFIQAIAIIRLRV